MTVGRAESLPKGLEFRRLPDGVEITFVKPPFLRDGRRGVWKAIAVATLTATVGILPLALFLLIKGFAVPPLILFAIASVVFAFKALNSAFDWKQEWAVIALRGELLTLDENPTFPRREWRAADLATIEAGPKGLDLVFKTGQKTTYFEKKSRTEISAVARLLRAALLEARLGVGEARLETSGECQVCCSALEDRIVLCAKCRTPHHEECWLYNGACSTYACREIRSTRPA